MYRRGGLGQTSAEISSGLNMAAQAAMVIPGYGEIVAGVLEAGAAIASMFHIGAGRMEADQIVPNQNAMMNYLGQITSQIVTGQNPSVFTLQQMFADVINVAQQFISFVSSQHFTDRRASGQALNTVMPIVDGSCGYPVPLPPYGQRFQPTRFNCLTWGDGTIGGAGSNGILGAIQRAIVARGGTVQPAALIQNAIPQIGTPGSSSLPQPGLSTPMPPAATTWTPPAPYTGQAPGMDLNSLLSDPITLGLIGAAILLWPK